MPTIMNLLGPLANPAGVRRQVIGVARCDARAARGRGAGARSGATHALVLHAAVGMDEISPSGTTLVWEVRDGRGRHVGARPGALGLDVRRSGRTGRRRAGGECRAGSSGCSPATATAVERCAVLLNAAAALYVSGNGWTLAEAAARAREALESGGAARALAELRRRRRPEAPCDGERCTGRGGAARQVHRVRAAAQYFRMTPTTTPWIRTSRS